MNGTGDYWVVAHVVAPEAEHIKLAAPSGCQAGSPRLGGGTRAPVTADGDGSHPDSGLGCGQVAGHPCVHLLD